MLIETVIIEYLKNALDVEVYAEEPDNDSTSYVVIEKTGSGRENYINTATVAIKSYGPSLYDAMVLNQRVKEAMDVLWAARDFVTDSSLNSDYNFSDTERHRYRYQAVYDITHY